MTQKEQGVEKGDDSQNRVREFRQNLVSSSTRPFLMVPEATVLHPPPYRVWNHRWPECQVAARASLRRQAWYKAQRILVLETGMP
jgi:hypothetical protein